MAHFTQEPRFSRCVRVSMQTLAVAIPVLLLAHGSAHAATVKTSACEPTRVSTLDRRLVAKADAGVDELRRFVEITQPVFALDMTGALQRVDRQREAAAACMSPVASK